MWHQCIKDFWRRWHISLTNFFRDYVYIPLGGNRRGRVRTFVNQYIVFFLTGLWHGASFNFILWGLGHGTLMVGESLCSKVAERFKARRNKVISAGLSLVQRCGALLSILLLWVLFRTGTKQWVQLVLKMFGLNYTRFFGNWTPVTPDAFLLIKVDMRFWILVAIGVVFSFPWWKRIPGEPNAAVGALLLLLKYLALGLLFILCLASLADNSYNPFIYFRF